MSAPMRFELGHVHVAILEDRLGEQAGAFGQGQHRHELRLHVGGKAGEGAVDMSSGLRPPSALTLIPLALSSILAPASSSRERIDGIVVAPRADQLQRRRR